MSSSSSSSSSSSLSSPSSSALLLLRRGNKKISSFVLCELLLCVAVPGVLSLAQLPGIYEGQQLPQLQPQLQAQAHPLPQSQPLVPWRLATFESLNVSALQAKRLPAQPSTWSQTSSCCGMGAFTPQAVALASARYGLFEPTAPCGWGPQIAVVAEWGYEFMNNQQHIFPVCGNLTMAAYSAPPASRQQAVQRLKVYWQCRARLARAAVNASASDPVLSIVGHYLFSGLAAEFERGAVIPGAEIGENINSIQLHLALLRGAARAWQQPFALDFSAWMQGFIRDFSTSQFWGQASSPVGGHSLSLFRRSYFTCFAAGASGLIVEAGAVNAFLEQNTSEGILQMSPLGEIIRELYNFTHHVPVTTTPWRGVEAAASEVVYRGKQHGTDPEVVRGIPYVPVALVVGEEAHGMGLGWFYREQAWDTFPLSEAEQRMQVHFEALWPGSFTVESQFQTPVSETGYLVPTAFGDLVDILLPDTALAAKQILSAAYRAVVVVGFGETGISQEFAGELTAFVEAGGALVVAADDVAPALANGWISEELLGLKLDVSPTSVWRSADRPAEKQDWNLKANRTFVFPAHGVRDLQTGWNQTAPQPGPDPFCSSQNSNGSGPFYIKMGGDPAVRTGWSTSDKCCSTDAATCRWFEHITSCSASLKSVPALCRPCPELPGTSMVAAQFRDNPADSDVGCPAWPAPSVPGIVSVVVANATLATAKPFLELFGEGNSSATIATVNSVNRGSCNGTVVTMLAPLAGTSSGTGANGFALVRHILERLHQAVSPVLLNGNLSSDVAGSAGVAMQIARQPWGWQATLTNPQGVVKQPGVDDEVDFSEGGRAVALTLNSAGDSANAHRHISPLDAGPLLEGAWVQDGGRESSRTPLQVDEDGRTVHVDIEAGGVRIVGLVLD